MGRLIYSAICSLDGYVTDRDGTFDWAEPDVWADADKVVYSSTLETVATRRTRLEREFDATGVRRMKDDATRDLSIGGPTLAAHALRAGLIDESQVLLCPVTVGGGTPVWPDDLRARLELVESHTFDSGVVFLRHLVVN